MLGSLDRSQVFSIIEALSAGDAKRVLACVEELDERAPDYREVLAELAALLQKLALLQAVPDLQLDEAEDIETYRRLAGALTPEDVQLHYQTAIIGRRDLELAPDARGGFEMTLLRMLAFRMAESAGVQASSAGATALRPAAAAASRTSPPARPEAAPAPGGAPASAPAGTSGDSDWSQLIERLNLQGPARQLATHCALISRQGGKLQLQLDPEGEHYKTPAMEAKLAQALSAHYGETVRLEFSVGASAAPTPAQKQRTAAEDRMQQARASIETDANVRAMRDIFGATVQPDSVRPHEQ
jgi:DNA polymerase-3 subunit gamma/tau